MQRRRPDLFSTIRTEGALLPPDLLCRAAKMDKSLPGLAPADYHLDEDERLPEVINRAWNGLLGAWTTFQDTLLKLPPNDPATTVTREKWLLKLFRQLGYGQLQAARPVQLTTDALARSFPVSHLWGAIPIHLVGARVQLDRRTPGVTGASTTSPHGMVQDLLNASEQHLWGVVSNGLTLRILRDNLSLTRQAYVEFDLQAMMEGEVYADFAVLFLTLHESRLEPKAGVDGSATRPENCWLERWSKEAEQQGTRALEALRDGVQQAIEALGRGFLSHPGNGALVAALRSGSLDKQDYYRQLLRIVYRLLFLFVAEDRDVLFDPAASSAARERYASFYSLGRLRRLAERKKGTPHADLWSGLRLVMDALGSDEGCAPLGLPALGSYLWSRDAVAALAQCDVANTDLLDAIRALAFVVEGQGKGSTRRAVDYKNLGSEELGSVYESLLELQPRLGIDVGTFTLATASGNDRKKTGSYYTPTNLIAGLLDSALDPILEEVSRQSGAAAALLRIKVCDPTCGSGHFLIAAAHRIARRLAVVRASGGEPPPAEYRHALRDVIGNCIYGVDVQEMAVELCKVALWMEALEPGKPLSFLDHRILCGNSLLGTTPHLLAGGIPDEAYTAIEGDDKKWATSLKKRNKSERAGQASFKFADGVAQLVGALQGEAVAIAGLSDATVTDVREKERRHQALVSSSDAQRAKLVSDAWCSAFVARKARDAPPVVTTETVRMLQNNPTHVDAVITTEVHRLAERHRFFHWHLAFPDVFRTPDNHNPESGQTGWSGGFDVIVGNPPWVRQETLKLVKSLLTVFRAFSGTADLYVFVLERGLQVVRPGGMVGLITPNKWFTADYAEPLRGYIRGHARVELLVDFGHSHDLFPEADTFPALVVVRAASRVDDSIEFSFLEAYGPHHASLNLTSAVRGGAIEVPHSNLRATAFLLKDRPTTVLIDRLMRSSRSVRTAGGSLFGIKTGFNDAFYIEKSTRELLLREDEHCESLIWPMIRGRDIHRWHVKESGLWHIVIPSSTDRSWPWSSAPDEVEAESIFEAIYPAIHAHLKRFEKALKKRQDQGRFWWELRSCDYYAALREPKILVGDMAWRSEFALDVSSSIISNSVYAVPTNARWIVACLNSRLMWWLFCHVASPAKDGARRYLSVLPSLPLPEDLPEVLIVQLEVLVERLEHPGRAAREVLADERQLDDLIVRAYGLTRDERALVDRSVPARDPIVLLEEEAALAPVLPFRRVEHPRPADRYTKVIPHYPLRVAAGPFRPSDEGDALGWIEPNTSHALGPDYFVAQVVGHSMEPRIPHESYCLFRFSDAVAEGHILLVRKERLQDPDVPEGDYTLKYLLREALPDGTHRVRLRAINRRQFPDIILNPPPDPWEDVRVVAEFIEVLQPAAAAQAQYASIALAPVPAIPVHERPPIFGAIADYIRELVLVTVLTVREAPLLRLCQAWALLGSREGLARAVAQSEFSALSTQLVGRQDLPLGLFMPALHDFVQDGCVHTIRGNDGRTLVRAGEGGPGLAQLDEWLRFDAALALQLVERLDSSKRDALTNQYSDEERAEMGAA